MAISPEEILSATAAVEQVIGLVGQALHANDQPWTDAQIAAMVAQTQRLHDRIEQDIAPATTSRPRGAGTVISPQPAS
jgi:hypothetical protein